MGVRLVIVASGEQRAVDDKEWAAKSGRPTEFRVGDFANDGANR